MTLPASESRVFPDAFFIFSSQPFLSGRLNIFVKTKAKTRNTHFYVKSMNQEKSLFLPWSHKFPLIFSWIWWWRCLWRYSKTISEFDGKIEFHSVFGIASYAKSPFGSWKCRKSDFCSWKFCFVCYAFISE